jgi:DNA-binding transcriptional MerR regulator
MSGNGDSQMDVIKEILRKYQANSLSYLRAKKDLQDTGLTVKEIEKLLEAIEYAEDVDELVEDDDEEVDD